MKVNISRKVDFQCLKVKASIKATRFLNLRKNALDGPTSTLFVLRMDA